MAGTPLSRPLTARTIRSSASTEINETLCDSAWKSQFFTSIMQPMMQFVGNLGYVIVCILGGYLAVKKVIEIGDIQSFIQYMRNFTATDHAACVHLQHPPADHRRIGARVRISR